MAASAVSGAKRVPTDDDVAFMNGAFMYTTRPPIMAGFEVAQLDSKAELFCFKDLVRYEERDIQEFLPPDTEFKSVETVDKTASSQIADFGKYFVKVKREKPTCLTSFDGIRRVVNRDSKWIPISVFTGKEMPVEDVAYEGDWSFFCGKRIIYLDIKDFAKRFEIFGKKIDISLFDHEATDTQITENTKMMETWIKAFAQTLELA
jgi:hypothetical protein